MSGYMIAMGACIGCGRVFQYNPERVPSITIKGTREPICRACVDYVNPLRAENGLAPIVPMLGAYEPQEC
jgi:hypothetical protein